MISQFFINRPIFATVVSIVIVIIGGITIPFLPVEQTPDITPPTVVVSASYPGANSVVISETVAAPIEEEVNGVEDMIYMSSLSSDDGTMDLTVTFEVGTDIDMATVLVQNRVAIAEPKLPEEVKRQGITTKKKSTNIVLMVNLYAPEGKYDEIFISNRLRPGRSGPRRAPKARTFSIPSAPWDVCQISRSLKTLSSRPLMTAEYSACEMWPVLSWVLNHITGTRCSMESRRSQWAYISCPAPMPLMWQTAYGPKWTASR
jgi:hypothetical protein